MQQMGTASDSPLKFPGKKINNGYNFLQKAVHHYLFQHNPKLLGEEQKKVIRKSFATASHKQTLGEPLDWMSNPRPEEWLLNGSKIHFDWT